MFRRVMRVLIALVVALGAAMPASVRAMPMPATDMAAGQPCQNCPQPDQTGNTTPDKMPICPMAACTVTLATLPAPALLPARLVFSVAYAAIPPTRWAEATPSPDPFPPRPVVLR